MLSKTMQDAIRVDGRRVLVLRCCNKSLLYRYGLDILIVWIA
jgi:hypothetical protein